MSFLVVSAAREARHFGPGAGKAYIRRPA